LKGNVCRNASLDFASTVASTFIFGEAAIDHKYNKAIIAGVFKSLDSRLDLSYLYKNISKEYMSFQSSAFTENTEAKNEKGHHFAMQFKINSSSTFHAYSNNYINEWPQYFNDGTRRGSTLSCQYNWNPKKKTNFYFRVQQRSRQNNTKFENSKTNQLGLEKITSYRIHFAYTPLISFMIRHRTEFNYYLKGSANSERGFMSYFELIYKPLQKPYGISARITYFETGGYDSRIYTYERDLLSYYAVPALYNEGQRNYILLDYKLNKHLQFGIKWTHTKNSLSAKKFQQFQNAERINNEWRMQLIWKT
jgi:hypothetical protein